MPHTKGKNMKKICLSFYQLTVLCTAMFGLDIPNASFEEAVPGQAPNRYFGKCIAVKGNARDGNMAVRHLYYGTNWDVFQLAAPFIECKPDTWYRFTVWNKNTAPSGDIFYGIRQCDKIGDDAESIYFNWSKVKPNISTWNKYTMEFKTSAKTRALSIYARVGENVPAGEVYWDNFSIEEIKKAPDPMTVRQFPALATFVDGENQIYEAPRENPYTGNWRKINPADEYLEIEFPAAKQARMVNLSIADPQNPGIKLYNITRPVSPGVMKFNLNLNQLPKGIYRLYISLTSGNQQLACQQKTIFRLKSLPSPPPPEPIRTTAVNEQGNWLVNGKPFTPVFYSHFSGSPDVVRIARQQFGMNTIHIWSDVSGFEKMSEDEMVRKYIADYRRQLDYALANRLYVMPALFRKGLINHQGFLNISAIRKIVKGLKDHPALLGWDLVDEPECYQITGDTMRKAYHAVKEADPDHVVWVNLCYREQFKNYSGCSDFASYDHYPIPSEPVSLLDEWNRDIAAAFPRKPLISYLQSYNPEGIRLPTYEELRAMAFINYVHNSQAMMVYAWIDPYPLQSMLSSPEMQSYYKALASEFLSLRDILIAPAIKQPDFHFPANIRFICKKNGMLLVNLSNKISTALDFELPSGKVSETIEPLGCRIYFWQTKPFREIKMNRPADISQQEAIPRI